MTQDKGSFLDLPSKYELDEIKLFAAILTIIVLLTILDILVDLTQGVEIIHIVVEAVIIPISCFGLFKVWSKLRLLNSENKTLRVNLDKVKHSAEQWKLEAEKHLSGLSKAIDLQLERWNLTKAEKEVTFLLLKGLSHKEIAEIRKTSERTTRQQSQAIYGKSGLSGRADLSAFFLEDLLTPVNSNV